MNNAELERALEHALFITDGEWRRLARSETLTPAVAMLLVLLAKAPHGLSSRELDEALPAFPNSRRKDPEFRQRSTIRCHLWNVRKQAPWALLGPQRSRLVELQPAARRRIQEGMRCT